MKIPKINISSDEFPTKDRVANPRLRADMNKARPFQQREIKIRRADNIIMYKCQERKVVFGMFIFVEDKDGEEAVGSNFWRRKVAQIYYRWRRLVRRCF